MGLFSFFKKAGKDVGKGSSDAPTIEPQDLLGVVNELNIPIDNLQVQVEGDTVAVSGEASSTENREKVILALGNVNGVACVDDHITVAEPGPEAVFYTVKSGDSLSKIAKAHYGDAMKYNVIFEANKPMLSNPDRIYPGQMLRIPAL